MHEVSRREAITLAGLGLFAAGCGSKAETRRTSAQPTPAARSTGAPAQDVAVTTPGPLKDPLLSSDVLVAGSRTIDDSTIERVRRIAGVVAVEAISLGSFYVDGRQVTYAAVNPATFRRYTQPGTAQTVEVWKRVADGEIAVQPALAKRFQTPGGYLKLGNGADARTIHIGAYAQLLDPLWAKQIDAVVNYRWVQALGLRKNNALLVSFGEKDPYKLRKQLQAAAGTSSVQFLGKNLDTSVPQTVLLTGGGSVAKDLGSFSYTVVGGGRVVPDPRWVATYIRTQQMPIIGPVTGNKVMLPRLYRALLELKNGGLSRLIYQFGGCYVPRYIAGTKTLSFHTFGTAVDFNVADNQRGTRGKMDPRVVQVFERWGFAWGGRWHYTDPMHFELARLVPVS